MENRYLFIDEKIAKEDFKGLREGVASLCYVDRAHPLVEFDRAMRYIGGKGNVYIEKLKETYDKGTLVSDSEGPYTGDDLTRAVFGLKKNFCDERINDVRRVMKSMYPTTVSGQTKNVSSSGRSNPKSRQEKKAILLAAGIVAAVAVVAILLH